MPDLPTYDPKAIPISRKQINQIRDDLEESPMIVDGYFIDVNEKAKTRISDAIEVWDELGKASISWTLADNTKQDFTRNQLEGLLSKIKKARAKRALSLHIKADELKALPAPTVRDAEVINWPTS